jgi:HK97 family phage major capsid protein
MATKIELEQKAGNAYHLFQQYLEEQLGAIRTEVQSLKTSALPGEDKAIILRLQEEVNKYAGELKTLQVALHAPSRGETKEQTLSEERKAAFNKYLHIRSQIGGSINALPEQERKHIKFDYDGGVETKALYAADGTTGGFLTVPEYVNELLKNIVLISPMSDIVDMRTTSKPYVMTPKRTQTAKASRISEQATRTETQNPKFGLVQNFPYESYAFTLVSRTDLDDSELDLASFVMSEFAEQFAVLQGYEFINGLGSSQSQAFGFLNDTAIVGAKTVTPAPNQLDYGSLVKLKTSLKPGYLKNATWVWTNETLGAIQQLTDNQGRPLWVPFGATLPDTIFSRPYIIAPDMPQIGNGTYPIAFGDFKKGYQGIVRTQISMQVLNERYADQNAVGFFGYYRFGGTTKISEAIKVLQMHS